MMLSQPIAAPIAMTMTTTGSTIATVAMTGMMIVAMPILSATTIVVIIRSCYSEDYSNFPPGLAKRGGNLPPGLERQLQRNGTLPPGLQRRVQPLPQSCERRLPRVPSGWFRVVLSGRIMLLDGGYRIMDIFALHGN